MRFSLRLNNDLPLALYPRLARVAEDAGFDQFWVSDDLFLHSVWIILASVAQATERIGIGTCIVNPCTMHPAEMAMAAASLNELAGGRALLGISSGAEDFLNWIGMRPERPVTAVAEKSRRCVGCGAASAITRRVPTFRSGRPRPICAPVDPRATSPSTLAPCRHACSG